MPATRRCLKCHYRIKRFDPTYDTWDDIYKPWNPEAYWICYDCSLWFREEDFQ